MVECDIQTVTALVIKAAREEIVPRFTHAVRDHKADGSVITAADLAMQERLTIELAQRWPQYCLLGEEMSPAEHQQLIAQPGLGLWCLDPLDGTSNFAAGLPFFAVSLSLIVDGQAILGIVYDPMRDDCFYATRGGGAWLNGERLGEQRPKLPMARCTAIVDYKRLPPALAQRLVNQPPYSSQRSFGSVALEWCWIAAGRAHLYLHGKQQLWDYSAGQLILDEAGGHSVTLEGDPVRTVTLHPRSAVAALNRELFHEWTAWLGSVG